MTVTRSPAVWLALVVLAGAAGSASGLPPAAESPPTPTVAEPPAAVEDSSSYPSSRLLAEPLPLQLDGFPKRPKPLLELGEPFLGTGTLDSGFRLPTGAVWQPSFLVFGSLRAAVQSFDRGADRVSEAVARLDLFGNLQLSGTERLVVGLRNLDQDGRFTGLVLGSDRPGVDDGFEDQLNARVSSLFFEGDFGEIFPNASRRDFAATDWGFSVGRQPLLFQDGLLINDTIDAVGITRNTLLPSGTANMRLTFLYGWNDLDRTDRARGRANLEDRSAQLFGLLTSTDFRPTTLDVDVVWVSSDRGELLTVGTSAVQRIGRMNSSFRVLSSFASGSDTALATDGTLLFSELSWTPHRTEDLFYVNSFWAFDDFASASRDPTAGGPLGRAGISFATVGLGNYGAALSSQARDTVGGAVGYQHFWNHTRSQWIAELGLRAGTEPTVADEAALSGRFQQALGRRLVVVVDAFAGRRRLSSPGGSERSLFGGRLELVTKF